VDLSTSFEKSKGQFYTNLLPKITFVKFKFAVRILNAFVKPCSIEQGGARFNEFVE